MFMYMRDIRLRIAEIEKEAVWLALFSGNKYRVSFGGFVSVKARRKSLRIIDSMRRFLYARFSVWVYLKEIRVLWERAPIFLRFVCHIKGWCCGVSETAQGCTWKVVFVWIKEKALGKNWIMRLVIKHD